MPPLDIERLSDNPREWEPPTDEELDREAEVTAADIAEAMVDLAERLPAAADEVNARGR